MEEGEFMPNGSIRAVYIFSLVAIFILMIACVNFINLSTAHPVSRRDSRHTEDVRFGQEIPCPAVPDRICHHKPIERRHRISNDCPAPARFQQSFG